MEQNGYSTEAHAEDVTLEVFLVMNTPERYGPIMNACFGFGTGVSEL